MTIELTADLVIAERFRLNRPLGRGAMGSVWHATHLGLETPCALKFIDGAYASHPEAHARFQLEAKAAAQLRSPHVVQILDHGVFEGMPYIAMELLEGEDLGQRLARVTRLPDAEAVSIALQICRALTKAHAAGIVHRDLKPANVFLVPDDDQEIAKVLDFGIAKSSRSVTDVSSTKTGAILGTPSYMSPEQAQGTKTVDHRSDLWSLAVIVRQCITGKLPFESEALGDLFLQIMVNPIPVPSHTFTTLPRAFDAWWERATARDPERRFQSARELGDSLSRVFALAPPKSAPEIPESVHPSTRSVAAAPGRRIRVPISAAIAAAAVLACFAIGATLALKTTSTPPVTASAPVLEAPSPVPQAPAASIPTEMPNEDHAPVNVITAVPLNPSPSPRPAPSPRSSAPAKHVERSGAPAAASPPGPTPKSSGPQRSGGGPKEFWSAIKNNLSN